MKKILLISLCLLADTYLVGQHLLAVNEQYTVVAKPTDCLDNTTIDKLFKNVMDFGIPFKYPQGGCESRAFAIGLILDSAKVFNYRIWVFSANKIDPSNSQMLQVKDLNDPSNIISWGYHTAAVVLRKNGNIVDTIVFDPSLVKEPLKYNEWLTKMDGFKESYYTFIPSNYFMFYTTFVGTLNKVDFFKYEGNQSGYNYGDMKLEKNLALDYTGRYLYRKYIKDKTSPNLNYIRPIISSINNFEAFVTKNEVPYDSQASLRQIYEAFPDFVIDSKNVFNRQVKKWFDFVNAYMPK